MEQTPEFRIALEQVKSFTTLTPDNLLRLYGYYKQATEGDVTGKRPGMLDLKGRAKFDAWSKCAGMKADAAMISYVALVAELKKQT